LTLACWTSVGPVEMVSDYNARKAFVAGKRPRASAGEHMADPLAAASRQNAAVTKGAQSWVEWTKCGRRRRKSTNGSMNSRRGPAGPMSPTDPLRDTRTPTPSRRRRKPPRPQVCLSTATPTAPTQRWTSRSCPNRVRTSPTADGTHDGRLGRAGRRRPAGSLRVEPPRRGHPLLELGGGPAVVDRGRGLVQRLAEALDQVALSLCGVLEEPVGDDPRGRVEQHDIAHRALLTCQRAAQHLGVVLRCAAEEALDVRGRQAEVARVHVELVHVTVGDLPDAAVPGGAQLVEAVLAAEDERRRSA